VGCIHGSEPAGIAIAKALAAQGADPVMRGADYWIVTDLNPDGVARATRQNAHGVDLNRNFPYLWQPIGARGASDYSGTAAGPEPETAAMVALVQRVRPTLAIWFHQHLAVVDDSEGPIAAERRFAALVGLPLAPLTDYPGSAVGWENHVLGATAFVVELPAGEVSGNQVRRYVGAVTTVAAERSP
jgi:protein MpaA